MKMLIEDETVFDDKGRVKELFIVTFPESHQVAADSRFFCTAKDLQDYIGNFFGDDILDPVAEPAQECGLAGGLKFDGDKPRMDLLDAEALEELTKVLTFGAKKYADENWRKGISFRRLLAAALRHVFAFMRGEDKDPETGLSHMAHAMCCAMFVIWMQRHRPDMDDRYKRDINEPSESKP